MTDEQIIKAVDVCRTGTCKGCPYHELYTASCINKLMKDAFHLIIRQRAEIENLKVELKAMRGAANSYKMAYEKETPYAIQVEVSDKIEKQIKTEAIKEFAETVKKEICKNTYAGFDKKGKPVNIWKAQTGFKDIDNLVKEMTGQEC